MSLQELGISASLSALLSAFLSAFCSALLSALGPVFFAELDVDSRLFESKGLQDLLPITDPCILSSSG